jgi:hypothetical protein
LHDTEAKQRPFSRAHLIYRKGIRLGGDQRHKARIVAVVAAVVVVAVAVVAAVVVGKRGGEEDFVAVALAAVLFASSAQGLYQAAACIQFELVGERKLAETKAL